MKLNSVGSLLGGLLSSKGFEHLQGHGTKTHGAKGSDDKKAEGLKKLESELAALLQKLQEFEKRFFGDSFDPGSTSSPIGGTSGAGGSTGAVAGSDGSAAGVDGSSAGGVSGAGNVVAGAGSSGIETNDPRLAQALDLIYSDPDGKKLIDAAKAAGLTQVISNPGLNPDGGAGTQGETYSSADGQRIEIADPGSADLIQTLGHELGHAATPGDGDSQTEEATVDALGNAIQQRLLGRSAKLSLDTGAYSTLQADNGIKLDLAQLGIVVP